MNASKGKLVDEFWLIIQVIDAEPFRPEGEWKQN